MSKTYVAGVGLTPFGVHDGRSGRDLFAEAGLAALNDADVHPDTVEEVYYGNFIGELAEGQGHQGPLMADAIGVTAPTRRLEGACASSGLAVRDAVRAIESGQTDVAIVGGMERLTNMSTTAVTSGLATAADAVYEGRAGITFPGAYALMANAYFDQYGGSRTDLAHIAVKNHANATTNPHAHFQRSITIDEALNAPMVASPLGLYDACPISDGAAALVLTSERYAESRGLEAPVAITGTGAGSDRLALQDRSSITYTPATEEAATDAYDAAGIDPQDIDFAEVHDCFTIAEVLALESLGFAKRGDGIRYARDGVTTPDGRIPVNLSGGLKAKGHPVGATGAAQVAAVTELLSGSHPNASRVPDSTVGIAHNAGGTVATATVHVLEVIE